MTDWPAWFRYQLKASADGLVWGFAQLNPEWLEQTPPDPQSLGIWPALRHLWHVTEYERCLALPSMQLWLGGPLPAEDAWDNSDEAWATLPDKNPPALIAAFLDVRQQQIALLDQLEGVDWLAARQTPWGDWPLSRIVTKTFQHTYEHADTLLRMGVWWEHILELIAQYQARADAQETGGGA